MLKETQWFFKALMMRISEESQQRGDEFHISNSICPLAQKYSHPYCMNVVTSFFFPNWNFTIIILLGPNSQNQKVKWFQGPSEGDIESYSSLRLSWWRICLQWGGPEFDPSVGKIPWKREGLSTQVFWPGELHGLCSPWGHKWSDMTEQLSVGIKG